MTLCFVTVHIRMVDILNGTIFVQIFVRTPTIQEKFQNRGKVKKYRRRAQVHTIVALRTSFAHGFASVLVEKYLTRACHRDKKNSKSETKS